jgi:hypothetical protein
MPTVTQLRARKKELETANEEIIKTHSATQERPYSYYKDLIEKVKVQNELWLWLGTLTALMANSAKSQKKKDKLNELVQELSASDSSIARLIQCVKTEEPQ